MNFKIDIPAILKSSSGEGWSMRVKGYLVSALPYAVLISKLLGHPIIEADFTSLIDAFVAILTAIGTISGTILWIKGWADRNFRKENALGVFAK